MGAAARLALEGIDMTAQVPGTLPEPVEGVVPSVDGGSLASGHLGRGECRHGFCSIERMLLATLLLSLLLFPPRATLALLAALAHNQSSPCLVV